MIGNLNMTNKTLDKFKSAYVPMPDLEEITARISKLVREHPPVKDGIGILLIGQSGAGKTAFLRSLARRIAQEYLSEQVQRPVILASMPSPCTPLAMSLVLRRSAGDWAKGGTATANLDVLEQLYVSLGVKLTCWDEVHNIGSDRVDLSISKRFFLKRIINNLKGVWVFCGLPEAEVILRQDRELDRRIRARFEIPQFHWEISPERHQFSLYLNRLDQITGLERSGLGEADLAARICSASRGLRGIAYDLVDEARDIALQEGTQKILLEHLSRAFLSYVAKGDHRVINPFSSDRFL